MLSKIIAISGLTLRTAIRSRVFGLLIAMVVICIAGLPFAIKSDGTAAGQTQLFMHYAFGLMMTLLSISAAWSAAGAISLEVAGRQMHILVTKPVHAVEIWLGKWLGLMIINLVILSLAGCLIYGLLRWNTRDAVISAAERISLREEILTAHRLIPPEPPDAKSNAGRIMFAVPPGATQSWTFNIPAPIRLHDAPFLQFQFAASHFERQTPVTGLWLIGVDNANAPYRVLGAYTPHVDHTLKLPAALSNQRLVIIYKNVETAAPATVIFASDNGAQLLVRSSSFESNFIRALLLAMARLTFFTALGLTIGALFSLPVAVFTTFAFLFITSLSGWISATALMAEWDLAPAWLANLLNTTANGIIRLAHFITPPLTQFDPLSFLPTGAFIPWALVGTAWATLALGYGGALAVLGAWIFSRREMGLTAT